MSHAEALESFAVKSYRYLRWSIVLVVFALIASVLIEAHRVKWCYEESISAYYYTPVHAVFVGALVTIGVSLIAIKGSTDWEDVLLNLAGVLAPIVAFVPTQRPGRRCSSIEAIVGELQPYINNNVLAFALGGAAALLLVFGFILFKRRSTFRQFRAQSLTVLIAGVAILVAGAVWYTLFRQHFLKYAHLGAAVGMFAVVGFVGSTRLSGDTGFGCAAAGAGSAR